jgi:hypothetical protein
MTIPEDGSSGPTLVATLERAKAARYGIAEWYGKDVLTMTSAERKLAADVATGQSKEKPACPFMATMSPGAKCNKKGGVCTIRKYERTEAGVVSAMSRGVVATTCPARFLGTSANNQPILEWVAEKMLDSNKAVIIKETPFLRQLLSSASTLSRRNAAVQLDLEMIEEASHVKSDDALPEEGKKAGRIDWLLMDPLTENDTDPKWCALETQAVYFSGDKMGPEFTAYSEKPDGILFPNGFRRPDYRSSGPKRLAPQLSVKVPVLRGWGKKVAVLVDRYFFDSMYDLPDAFTHGRTDKEKRDNCEVAWFVVDYDDNMRLTLHDYRFSTLAGSVEALNATAPMSKETFNSNLRKLASDKKKFGKKVFRP